MKRFFFSSILFLVCYSFIYTNPSVKWDASSRVYYKYKDISGYVYFEGFNFEGYEAESEGIEPMLARTLELLQTYYGNNGTIGKNQPFVFVGHSQGGLRVLAMSTYLKQHDPQLYKQLKGVITISGIDRGLKLLEDKGSNFRAHLYNDTRILTNGVVGTIKLVDFIPGEPFTDFLIYNLTKEGIAMGSQLLVTYLLGDWMDISNDFGYPIMHNEDWDGHAQIRDMVPQSDFIKKYVLTEETTYKQHKSKTTRYLAVIWKKGIFGIKYPTLGWKNKPVIVQTQKVDMKVDKNLPLTFLAGTNSNTLSLASENVEKDIRKGVNIAEGVFRTAEYLHIAKSVFGIGLLTGSPAAAIDCNRAANWCDKLDYQIGELIGEQTHDGLVALYSQHLPTATLVGTGYDAMVLTNTTKEEYKNYNHATIAEEGSESKIYAEKRVRTLLGR